MLLISRIPESPIWLLSKKRADDAKKSLCWLRGWVTLEVVNKEFSDLNCPFEAKISQRNATDANKTTIENARKNFIDKIVGTIGFNDILRKSVLRPLFLVSMYFGFSNFAGVANTRPYMVEILKEFGTSLDPILLTVTAAFVIKIISVFIR